jgi:hypothetical protein
MGFTSIVSPCVAANSQGVFATRPQQPLMPIHREDLDFLPAHRKTEIHGLHGYLSQASFAAGDTVGVHASNDGPVRLQLIRLGAGRVGRVADAISSTAPISDLGSVDCRELHICCGSYVHVTAVAVPTALLALEIWFRQLAHCGCSGLINHEALTLCVNAEGKLEFRLGGTGGAVVVGGTPSLKVWHHAWIQCDTDRLELFLDGELVGNGVHERGREEADFKTGSLRLGALLNGDGEVDHLFTGDICAPAIYDRVFRAEEIRHRFRTKELEPASSCVGHWKFDGLSGPPYRDTSGAERHGRGGNYPLRMIPGPALTEEQPWAEFDPTSEPSYGHAVRLMADQLVDCRWPELLSWTVPDDLPQGQYAVRLGNEIGASRDLPFIVRAAKPAATLMVLSTTGTRLAYNYMPFGDPELDYGAYLNHPSYPMLGHLLGQRRPARGEPFLYQVVNLELPLCAWLDQHRIPYDLYSEWDLESDPSLLDHYGTVAWAGHCEYWTAARYEGLSRFRDRGGHILALSGNTCFWRVSIDLENEVMEVRKHGAEQARDSCVTVDAMVNNAHWHQMDHLPGTLMQTAGWPQYRLGLGMTNGWSAPCRIDGDSAGYEVLAPEHLLFHHPYQVSVATPFAPGGAGYETDVSYPSMVSRFGEAQNPVRSPRSSRSEAGTDNVAKNSGLVLARARLQDALVLDLDMNCSMGELWSEMQLGESEAGGITFAAGSCMAALVLTEDQNFSNFMLNVLHRMGLNERRASGAAAD